MKKFWFEILLVVLGIVVLCIPDPDPKNTVILQAIGVGMILMAIIWFFVHLLMIKSNDTHHKQFPARQRMQSNDFGVIQENNQDTGESYVPKQRASPPTPPKQQTISASNKEADRKQALDAQIELFRTSTETEILDMDDINYSINLRINASESQYLCERVMCPVFGMNDTVWDIKQKIETLSLSDKEILNIFTHGTRRLRDRFTNACESQGWTMPSAVFDDLLKTNKLFLLRFPYYTSDMFRKLIDQMDPYERLGYRVRPNGHDEAQDGIFENALTQENVPYYEDIDTDVVYVAEQQFSSDNALRAYAFDSIFAGPRDLLETIGRLDNLSSEEVQKIFGRGNNEELEKMLERSDSDTIVDYLPPKYAIKVVLGVIPSEYSDYIHENFDFDTVDHAVWLELFEELTPDELTGHRMKKISDDEEPEGFFSEDGKEDIPYYTTGDHDIIKLIEDHASDDDAIRKPAFAKVAKARYLKDIIESVDNVNDYEVTSIMERNNPEDIEALLERNDADDIIGDLPDEVAIKIRLQLIYESASDNVENYYKFNNSGAFITLINDLSPYELLGFRMKPNTSDEVTNCSLTNQEHPDEKINFYNNAEYDIITLIESQMNDDLHLRQLAFAKICESKNMDDAIGRWENITQEEVATIIARGFTDELDALMGREDFDSDIVDKLPDEFIIKHFLTGDNETINEAYNNRIDDKKFLKKVESLTASLSDKMTEEEEQGDVDDLSDDIVIKITLSLIDPSDHECSFDHDDVSDEFVKRMELDDFKAKVETLVQNLM